MPRRILAADPIVRYLLGLYLARVLQPVDSLCRGLRVQPGRGQGDCVRQKQRQLPGSVLWTVGPTVGPRGLSAARWPLPLPRRQRLRLQRDIRAAAEHRRFGVHAGAGYWRRILRQQWMHLYDFRDVRRDELPSGLRLSPGHVCMRRPEQKGHPLFGLPRLPRRAPAAWLAPIANRRRPFRAVRVPELTPLAPAALPIDGCVTTMTFYSDQACSSPCPLPDGGKNTVAMTSWSEADVFPYRTMPAAQRAPSRPPTRARMPRAAFPWLSPVSWKRGNLNLGAATALERPVFVCA
jgi:hypothetical protein